MGFVFIALLAYAIYNEWDKKQTAMEIAEFFVELDNKKIDK